jgi:hypothetical protein
LVLILGGGVARATDPTTAECLAASEASLKYGNQHKPRAERSQLLVCAAASCPSDIRKECVRRVDEVNGQIPTLIFAAKDASGADISAVRVSMDGEPLAERLEGLALSVDPGEHTFTFEAAGQAPFTKKIVILEAQKDRRELVTIGTPTTPPVTAAPHVPGATEAEGGLGVQKALAIACGGLGFVGLGVGTAFGLVALSKKSDAQSVCPNECATQADVNKWSDAKSAGNLSTIAFLVGGVALAAGAALWFTAKPTSSKRPSAQMGVGPGSFLLRGAW